MSNKQKTAIVTGSRRGIGLGIAKALLQEGYFVVMSAKSSDCELLNQEVKKYEGLYCYVPCDITDEKDRKRLLNESLEKCGRIDLMVNNAGVSPKIRADILKTTEESYDFVVDTNTKGTFFMSQLIANEMIKKINTEKEYHPRIVNISSMSAYTSSYNRGEYCISKAGISMITKLFADRLAEYEIPVFEVRPGIIDTDMTSGVHEDYENKIKNGITPIKRFGTPADVADSVLAAASGKLDFTTGQILNADGGFHLRRM